jgi:crossover junction endodeoxyribonuclease RuvC
MGASTETILGIDPGTATMGYGAIVKTGSRLQLVTCGVIRTRPSQSTPERLLCAYREVGALLDGLQPSCLVTERLFFAKNETTAFAVGRAIGAVLLAAAERGVPWFEYTPPEVKQAVVGYGGAEKRQIQFMVQRLLGMPSPPKPDDAADALAVAICHAHTLRHDSL